MLLDLLLLSRFAGVGENAGSGGSAKILQRSTRVLESYGVQHLEAKLPTL